MLQEILQITDKNNKLYIRTVKGPGRARGLLACSWPYDVAINYKKHFWQTDLAHQHFLNGIPA